MKTILFVGEHPFSLSGNGNMMNAILHQVDTEKYRVIVYATTRPYVVQNIGELSLPPKIHLFTAADPSDNHGGMQLFQFLQSEGRNIDVMMTVGIDIWQWGEGLPHFRQIRDKQKITWISLCPYDLHNVRDDWLSWFSYPNVTCVFSEYGYNMVKDRIDNARYYRPPLWKADRFHPFNEVERANYRASHFTSVPPGTFLFGFVGGNQIRKDPARLVKAFCEVRKDYPEIKMYLHMAIAGSFNINKIAVYCGADGGDIIIKQQGTGRRMTTKGMVGIYNSLDCLVNVSMQEGLSWTLLEAMLCGTPVMASYNTAQMELIGEGAGIPLGCNELGWVPVGTASGVSHVESRHVTYDHLVEMMTEAVKGGFDLKEIGQKGRERALEWLEGVDDVNDLLAEVLAPPPSIKKIQKILFIQHSSAGDVLMSTQCFKGIRERHPDIPLVYMTQKQYQDIVTDHPLVDEIIDYDLRVSKDYEVVYNPHGDRIRPGGFNNLDDRLTDMYPYFCRVDADKVFIQEKEPVLEHYTQVDGKQVKDLEEPLLRIGAEYIIVHTTGGDPRYRTYNHMQIVVQLLRSIYKNLRFVQMGHSADIFCNNVDLDLRGKLTWRESAWVMKRAKAAVVIDSFPSHLAGAVGTPAIVIYGPAPARVTQPRDDENVLTHVEPNKLDHCPNMTNCWGRPGEAGCDRPCINTISPIEIVNAMKELIGDPR